MQKRRLVSQEYTSITNQPQNYFLSVQSADQSSDLNNPTPSYGSQDKNYHLQELKQHMMSMQNQYYKQLSPLNESNSNATVPLQTNSVQDRVAGHGMRSSLGAISFQQNCFATNNRQQESDYQKVQPFIEDDVQSMSSTSVKLREVLESFPQKSQLRMDGCQSSDRLSTLSEEEESSILINSGTLQTKRFNDNRLNSYKSTKDIFENRLLDLSQKIDDMEREHESQIYKLKQQHKQELQMVEEQYKNEFSLQRSEYNQNLKSLLGELNNIRREMDSMRKTYELKIKKYRDQIKPRNNLSNSITNSQLIQQIKTLFKSKSTSSGQLCGHCDGLLRECLGLQEQVAKYKLYISQSRSNISKLSHTLSREVYKSVSPSSSTRHQSRRLITPQINYNSVMSFRSQEMLNEEFEKTYLSHEASRRVKNK